MNPIETFNKYALIAVIALCFLSTCNSCNSRRQLGDVQDRCDSLQTQLNKLPTAAQVNTQMEINSLETSKRMLYDQNAIVRTAIRPDDRMNEYDAQIKELKKSK
jgi:hypothetical protein